MTWWIVPAVLAGYALGVYRGRRIGIAQWRGPGTWYKR